MSEEHHLKNIPSPPFVQSQRASKPFGHVGGVLQSGAVSITCFLWPHLGLVQFYGSWKQRLTGAFACFQWFYGNSGHFLAHHVETTPPVGAVEVEEEEVGGGVDGVAAHTQFKVDTSYRFPINPSAGRQTRKQRPARLSYLPSALKFHSQSPLCCGRRNNLSPRTGEKKRSRRGATSGEIRQVPLCAEKKNQKSTINNSKILTCFNCNKQRRPFRPPTVEAAHIRNSKGLRWLYKGGRHSLEQSVYSLQSFRAKSSVDPDLLTSKKAPSHQ